MSNWIREAQYVEDKFLEQLAALGWKTLVVKDNDNKNRTATEEQTSGDTYTYLSMKFG